MPRSARIVIPDVPHHVTQRGNRKQRIFFDDADRRAYLSMLRSALEKHQTKCVAWCLMDNHVHLILLPRDEDGLRAPLASAHTRYSQLVNRKQDATGHLFQGRFASYAMDDPHLMAAARYVENNPVQAGLVKQAQDWPWSSARAHISNQPDGLTDIKYLRQHIANWRAMLTDGLEAADAVEKSLKSGRPLAHDSWLKEKAAIYGFAATASKRGRPVRIK